MNLDVQGYVVSLRGYAVCVRERKRERMHEVVYILENENGKK